MLYRMDELLLIELLTYLPEEDPLRSLQGAEGKTVGEFLAEIDRSRIEDGKDYAVLMNGLDWRNILMALDRKENILRARILETHVDQAYGAGGGFSAVLLDPAEGEAVVAFRGTGHHEWVDDFMGANQIDPLQQINALEWYKSAYERLGLSRYTVSVIGHSKGGTKAKYITVLNDTPARCLSFDGQGFSDEFMMHYRDRILKRQDLIENHNIDFDYINILMNDVGKNTYYVGFDYGRHGFAETHCPNTFFNFRENGEYTLRVNPNGQRPEMQILNQFINSMIRSGFSRKEQLETNRMVGMLVEKAFGIGAEHTVTEYINFLCDMVGDPQYRDNTAYCVAFIIKYARTTPEFLKSLKDIMHSFQADGVVKVLDLLEDLVNSRRFAAFISLGDFLIQHVNGVLTRQVQAYCRKKHRIELTEDQIRGVLQIVTMTRETLKTLEIHTDGSDLVLEEDTEEVKARPEEIRVVVLAGGLSNERNLSLKSGYRVSEILAEEGYPVILLDAFMGYGEQEESIPDAFADPRKYSLERSEIPEDIPDLWAIRKRRTDQSSSFFGPNVLQICKQADIVFIALHGAMGENGKVQAAFDLHGIDYTGCDYFSSALSSNKAVAKKILTDAGILVPKGFLACRGEEEPDPETRGMRYPLIVKPNNGGIGLGISVVSDREAYHKALQTAYRWENEILVEEYIAGREFAVGVLEGKALPVIEVLPLETGEDNTGMTLRGETARKCPAEIPERLAGELQRTAERVCRELGVKALGKVDFILRENGSFVCLECDSLPQLYEDSHVVLEAEAAGISFAQLCDRLMEMSIRTGAGRD